MNRSVRFLLIALLLSPLLPETTFSQADSERPNLLFVFSDQHRRQSLGFMNEDPVFTPNIDRFAQQGVVLNHAVSNVPKCSPYRAMLLTGRFPTSTGVTKNVAPGNPGLELPADELSIAEVLQQEGYRTGYIGKWHLDDASNREQVLDYDPDNGRGWDTYTPPGPERQGFEFWYAFNAYGDHANPHYWMDSPEMIEANEWSPQHEVSKAIEFMEGTPDREPFALFVSHLPPHGPYVPPQQYREVYEYSDTELLLNRPNADPQNATAQNKVKGYFASVTGVDDQFGRLMDYLDRSGLAENTIVVFTSDHGEMMASHGRFNKGIYYEESIGIPFIIRWPQKLGSGRNETVMGVPDVMPTLLGLMEVDIPEVVEGRDFSPHLQRGTKPKRNMTFLANYGGSAWRGIRTQRYTYVVNQTDDGPQRLLYDNRRDPYQLHPITENGTAGTPDLQRFDNVLERWLRVMNDPFLEVMQ